MSYAITLIVLNSCLKMVLALSSSTRRQPTIKECKSPSLILQQNKTLIESIFKRIRYLLLCQDVTALFTIINLENFHNAWLRVICCVTNTKNKKSKFKIN